MLSIRKTLSCLAAGAVAAAALLAGPVAAADAPVVIHESFPSKVATFWPSFVAQAQGFYTGQGLQVEDLVVDPNVTVSTLIGGSVEVSFADSTQLLLALEKGANLVAVGIETDKNPYKLMAPAAIKTLTDLKGKRIGVASAIDIYTYVAREMLRKAGLDPDKDVEWVVGGGQNQRLSAIVAERSRPASSPRRRIRGSPRRASTRWRSRPITFPISPSARRPSSATGRWRTPTCCASFCWRNPTR